MDICELLRRVCDAQTLTQDTELIDSGILDSLAVIELVTALEDEGIILHLTRIDRNRLKTPAEIALLVDEIKMGVQNNAE